MGSKSDYLEKKLLDHILGGGGGAGSFYTSPTTVYVALFTISPNDAGSGGTEISTSGTGYGRVGVTNNVANWPNAAGATATKNNANAIAFAAALTDWGTITAFGLYDNSAAGNLLYWGAVNSPSGKIVNTGDTLTFPATTGLVITED